MPLCECFRRWLPTWSPWASRRYVGGAGVVVAVVAVVVVRTAVLKVVPLPTSSPSPPPSPNPPPPHTHTNAHHAPMHPCTHAPTDTSPQAERKQITDAKAALGLLEHKMHNGQVAPPTVARLQELTTGLLGAATPPLGPLYS
jgi:hypothetical protein